MKQGLCLKGCGTNMAEENSNTIAFLIFDFEKNPCFRLRDYLQEANEPVYFFSCHAALNAQYKLKANCESDNAFCYDFFKAIRLLCTKSFSHVVILNSLSYPLKPVSALKQYINENKNTDFINYVSMREKAHQ